jgi:hypothetical protein
MIRNQTQILILSSVAALLGIGLAKIDTSVKWDDTAVMAFSILLIAALCSFIRPNQAWLWALLIGLPTALLNILLTANYGALLALVFSFVGAYASFFVRRIL